MLTPFLLTVLLCVPSVDGDSAPTEPLKFSIGSMSFSGDTIKLTKSGKDAFECEINGHATLKLGDGEVSMAAQRIVISCPTNSHATFDCTGACKLSDSTYHCSADRMRVHFADQYQLEMTGNCRVQSGEGADQIQFSGETITFQGGEFHISRAGKFKRGQ